ncbi:zeta toxin family protein [Chitinophaga silvisoli]|uniref:Zeta toxin n=1 Tax=Chitinophaga silvisoli TaxID=2291814 RepID=A0A3E1P7E2_9BACT|nr:zeta toxin family protein [Chitinophaga silvisoli]RFM36067.1 zeta toxin [Chitinophaga silvisoli]
MPNLYIIAGCNGAGKTTASYTVLPEILECKEFVNADSIAAGLSPFNPESVALEAGRLMLQRINTLLEENVDFAFETTLSTRSYASFIKKARTVGYTVTLLYFWLNSPEFAMSRVAERVERGGHNIPEDIIKRRYYRGIYNLLKLYIPICNIWTVLNNMSAVPEEIASGYADVETIIINPDIWDEILHQGNHHE